MSMNKKSLVGTNLLRGQISDRTPISVGDIPVGTWFYGAMRTWSSPRLLLRTYNSIVDINNSTFTWEDSSDLFFSRYTPCNVEINTYTQDSL